MCNVRVCSAYGTCRMCAILTVCNPWSMENLCYLKCCATPIAQPMIHGDIFAIVQPMCHGVDELLYNLWPMGNPSYFGLVCNPWWMRYSILLYSP